ncbi:unnamed protein product [Boreogadus saida]
MSQVGVSLLGSSQGDTPTSDGASQPLVTSQEELLVMDDWRRPQGQFPSILDSLLDHGGTGRGVAMAAAAAPWCSPLTCDVNL